MGTRHAETGCGLSKVSTARVDQSSDENDESIDDDNDDGDNDVFPLCRFANDGY